MGSSFSSDSNPNPNPNLNHYHHHHRPHHNPSYYPNNTTTTPPPPYLYPSSTPHSTAPPPNTYGYAPSNPYPPPSNHYNYHSNNYPPQNTPNYYYPGWQNSFNYGNSHMGQAQARPNQGYSYGNGWAPPAPRPVFVEHQNAKVIKNDVNVHKDSIKLEVDENFPDYHLVSFIFDARFDGSMTVSFFAKEEKESGIFILQSPRALVRVPFQEGTGQKFRQPSGTGVNLRYYNTEVLEKPSADGIFPIVIMAEVTSSSQAAFEVSGESLSEASQRAQITQAVIEKKSNGSFEAKVIKQILLVDGDRYEVHELYGIGGSSTQGFNDDDPGKECVICMSEPKDTAVMPCRHLCMCSDCAKELRRQSDKCPICRQPITELIEIKINNTDEK